MPQPAHSSPACAVWRLMYPRPIPSPTLPTGYPVSLRRMARVRGRAGLPRRPSCFPIASTPWGKYDQERLSFATSEREIREARGPPDKKYSGFVALFVCLPR